MTDNTQPEALREGRWYMVTHDGVATLCEDRRDAEKEAKDADMAWPHSGPHRAVQLVEASTAGFTAADMATASAQGFSDGAASVAANAGEPSGHIKEPYTLAEVKAKIASNDYSAEMLLQHAMLLLDSASLSANAGEPTQGAFQRALSFRTAQGWNLGGDKVPVLYTDEINGEQVCRDDVWLCTTAALAAPPTAQAEGWISVDERLPPPFEEMIVHPRPDDYCCEAFCDTAGNWKWAEYERNFGVHHRPCTVTHWKPNLPPTSAEGVEHG